MASGDATETVRKLRELAALQIGGPLPEWLDAPNNWGAALSKLASDAADLIERLQGK
jgi:hypothetical protein